MTRVLILGANGQLARNTTRALLDDPALTLTLYLRRSSRLKNPAPDRVTIVEGDVLDAATLRHAMHATGLKRLIFISSMGIYGEVPGEKYRSVLDPYRDSAALIEASDLDYTILRPGWFTREPEGAFQITQKGDPFQGHDISLDSLSALIARIATTPGLYVHSSIGVSDN
jgi:uncharacterized protein YbjT (DUF2867 family)